MLGAVFLARSVAEERLSQDALQPVDLSEECELLRETRSRHRVRFHADPIAERNAAAEPGCEGFAEVTWGISLLADT